MLIDLLKKQIPEYKITLPVSKKKIVYRPMLVKEEKFISQIMQFNTSPNENLHNLCNLVDSCCDGKISSMNLPFYDFQYLLVEIRKNSVSEKSEVLITCPYTKQRVKTDIDLNSMVKNKKTEETLEIQKSNLIINFRKPLVTDFMKLHSYPTTKETTLSLIIECLQSVQTEKEKIDLINVSLEEKQEFIELLDIKDFNKIKKFILSGYYKFDIEYKTEDNIQRKVEVFDIVNFLKFYMAILIC